MRRFSRFSVLLLIAAAAAALAACRRDTRMPLVL